MFRLFSALTTLFFWGSSPLWANPITLSDSDDWRIRGILGLFAAAKTNGDVTVAGNTAALDMNLRDALEHLDFTTTGRLEAWRGRLGLIAEGHYIGLSETATLSAGPGAGRSAEVESTQSWLGLLVGYRAFSGELGNGRPYAFDVQGGARYNRLTQSVVGSGGLVNAGGTERWWEPVVGARYAWEIADSWTGAVAVDASGFGANGNDLAWSANLAISKQFNARSSVVFGWRHYDINFETTRSDGAFGADFYSTGPFIAYAYTFR